VRNKELILVNPALYLKIILFILITIDNKFLFREQNIIFMVRGKDIWFCAKGASASGGESGRWYQ